MLKPLDPGLNSAILCIAAELFPDGFDVSSDAPDTYRKLRAHLDVGRRMGVYNGGCENTIYAYPYVNYAFRAWHDPCHYSGKHNFSLKGEQETCLMQCSQLRRLYGDNGNIRHWANLLDADIVGVCRYYQ